ncbi:MAG: hypothetical protein ABFS32_21220 [Bacteroidota bacterium]
MNTNYLLPNRFKTIGWFLFIPGIILGILWLIYEPQPRFLDATVFAIAESLFTFSFIKNNIYDEITGLLIIIGSIFIALSREKSEDEYISKIRLDSLVWATYINYTIVILAIIFVYDFGFYWVLVINVFTILFFFIIRFNWALYRSKKQIQDEE